MGLFFLFLFLHIKWFLTRRSSTWGTKSPTLAFAFSTSSPLAFASAAAFAFAAALTFASASPSLKHSLHNVQLRGRATFAFFLPVFHFCKSI